jgi:hypothetical protein
MNNVIQRRIVVTGSYQPLSAESVVFSGTISTPPSNAQEVFFLGDDGSDVLWIAGEWHDFSSVDLAEIKVKGNPGDVVTVVGGTW